MGVGWPSRSLRSGVERTMKAGGELYSSPEPDPSESGAFMMISAVSMFSDGPDDSQQISEDIRGRPCGGCVLKRNGMFLIRNGCGGAKMWLDFDNRTRRLRSILLESQ